MRKEEILSLVQSVKNMKKDKSNALPNNSFFLDTDNVVCFPNSYGDSRYPYDNDGLVLFAHSNGYIDCVEATVNVFRPVYGGLDNNSLSLFAGEWDGKNYSPISITGAEASLSEDIIERYTVFTPACAYYITETEKAIFSARVYVDDYKDIRVSLSAINKAETRNIYLSAYMEPTLSDKLFDGIYFRMPRFAEICENGNYILSAMQDGGKVYMNVNRETNGNVLKKYSSVAKNSFMCRRGATAHNALSLKTGEFLHEVKRLNTVDWTVAADMIHFELPEDGFVSLDYILCLSSDEKIAKANVNKPVNSELADIELDKAQLREKEIFSKTKIEFLGDWKSEKVNSNIFNSFLRSVQKQASFCALGKNYAGMHLGIRDVFQQLESALIWQPEECRKQIVKVMNYMFEDGRPPRQVAFPVKEGDMPDFDARPFIDQGYWIISTLYTYLSYTDDYSILDEICGYYTAVNTMGPFKFCDVKDSLLDHAIKITDFLLRNVDEDTGCQHILFGDWNDALHGLGRTEDTDKEFGTGVSLMASFQLYLTLTQMSEIIEKTTANKDLIERYKKYKENLVNGILKYAVVENEEGIKRFVHGWGDNRSYYVGSYNDFDGKSRISLTSNAFAANSGMIYEFPELKQDIVKTILASDTKYGLLTFSEAFEPKDEPYVGRIATITKGTYENCCTYVHAGTFGIMALFLMGYPKKAWEILEKTIVISHENVTLTSFIMPNSYCQDDYYGFDGESMGDWHTGSGTVILKEIIKYAFGIEPLLDKLKIAPAGYFPTDKAQISVIICGKNVTVKYSNENKGSRKILFNGEPCELSFDDVRDTYYTLINKNDLKENNIIEVID